MSDEKEQPKKTWREREKEAREYTESQGKEISPEDKAAGSVFSIIADWLDKIEEENK